MLMSADKATGKPLELAQVARLRFRHLQFLDILGKTRNLRLTAEQMHMTQPAATKVLMDIEEMLESRLFDRLPRGMRPNELGLFTLRYAHSALDGHRKFVDEFSSRAKFEGARISTIDGVRADWPDGWGLVRASNTTPSLVLRFDAKDQAALQRIQAVFREQMLAVSPQIALPF